jgi:hypothetical protein
MVKRKFLSKNKLKYLKLSHDEYVIVHHIKRSSSGRFSKTTDQIANRTHHHFTTIGACNNLLIRASEL